MGENVLSWISTKIKGYDIFGRTIIPTYNTKLGGTTSLCIFVIMLYTAITLINSVLNYSEIKFNKNEKKITLALDQEDHLFASGDGVKFAIRWSRSNRFQNIDKSYGEIVIVQHSFNCSGIPLGG